MRNGIDGRDVRGLVRITPGQAAIAASDLQNVLTIKIHYIEQGAGFVVFRVYAECQLDSFP